MGFPTPITAAKIAAAGGLIAANNLSDVAAAAAALANLSGAPLALTVNAQTGTAYTLVASDLGKLISLSNASTITVTVPANSSVPFAVGAQINLVQIGAGQVVVAGAGGVTVNATPGLKCRAQYSYATLIKRATDTWDLLGDLSA